MYAFQLLFDPFNLLNLMEIMKILIKTLCSDYNAITFLPDPIKKLKAGFMH